MPSASPARGSGVALAALLLAGCAGGGAAAAPEEEALAGAGDQTPAPAPPSQTVASVAAPPPALPVAAATPPPEGAQLAAGADFTCAVDAEGGVRCWGSNRYGQLGDPALPTGLEAARAEAPPVAGLPPTVAVAAGAFHVCALARDRGLRCWGHGGYGQLGDGALEDRAAPVRVVELEDVVSVAAGRAHTCAVRGDGSAWCWGDDARGQLGSEAGASPRPRAVAGLAEVRLVRAGRDHTCALRTDGAVWCWGDATEGALGDGARPDGEGLRRTATRVALPVDRPAVDLAAGGGSSCARLASGEVRCWGRDDSGQLGTGRGGRSSHIELRPRPVPDLEGALAVALGSRHACALLPDRSVACAGWNGRGQLGDGTDVSRPRYAPVLAIPASTRVQEVSAGSRHTCARLAPEGMRCWGDGRRAQLGPPPYPEPSAELPP